MVRPIFVPRIQIVAFLLMLAAAACAQDSRKISEPRIPPICTTLEAVLSPHSGALSEADERHHRDNARIEHALSVCPAGQAVRLNSGGQGKTVFLIAPMHLHTGVTLLVSRDVAIWGSRDPRDYDNAPGSCGIVAPERGPGCKPLILADHAANSGIMGDGVIDGRGGAKLLGANETWWELAHRAKVEDANQSVSRLIVVRNSDDFTLYRITLRNSPNCHVSTEHVHGFTAWSVKIDTPKWARNTDGIDPSSDTSDITIAHSFIRSGDDNISPKSTINIGSVTRMTVTDTHFYNGHGIGLGSQTSGGMSHILVDNLSIDSSDNGLRIKSDKSRGGLVENVQFQNICIRNSPNPIVLNPFYTTFDGTRIPVYRGIFLHNVHALTPGSIIMRGLDADHRLEATLSNVVIDDQKPDDVLARYAVFGSHGGNLTPTGEDVTVNSGSASVSVRPYSCADKFPPFPEEHTAPASAELIPPADNTFYVAADGTGDYYSVQSAVNHVPASGGLVLVAPGTYREQVIINQSHVTLKSANSDPAKTIIVDDTSQGTRGNKPSYATVHVLGDDFHAENITFQNDFNRTHQQVFSGSQAQALNLEGDRNVISNVHILANQDTLYIGARGCGQAGSRRSPAAQSASAGATPAETQPAPCVPVATRSYFKHCIVAGNVDYIYGDGNAVFDNCEIHNTEHAAGGYLTAQGRYSAAQQSSFVFNHCRMTAEPGVTSVYLGRPWRPYASVVYLNTELGAHINPNGWREWHPGETHSLDTAFFAEFQSTGPGANPAAREPKSHQLTSSEAEKFQTARFLSGPDHWNPEAETK
jgi:polygalacturonase